MILREDLTAGKGFGIGLMISTQKTKPVKREKGEVDEKEKEVNSKLKTQTNKKRPYTGKEN